MIASLLPGAPPLPEALADKLRAALAAKGAGYVPRTHHLIDGKTPKYTNRLVLEPSPYLLQHAHNPVNWYAWGDEAFADARRMGRPVFLSIGYSTCHWCHVMEGESFEDEEIAAFMNAHYICIKVDREERPDVDAVYMSAVQSLTGSGGWPMSVWLTPDREPFFGGTYFPPRDGVRGSRHGFLSLLRDLAATYKDDAVRVKRATASLTDAVKKHMEAHADGGAGPASLVPGASAIASTVTYFKRAFDPVHGGLQRAPKFPSNLPVRLLLRYHRRSGDAEALRMATMTLEKMAGGGMYDQIGGGFHRYSTDARWLQPHFEKMLYDNALLVVAYAEAHQVTLRADFARVVREICDYLLREMTAPDGGFYSATDADSEGEEGKFFVWSLDEVKRVLGADADAFAAYYDITAGGNFEGHNIANVKAPDDKQHAALADARRKLYQVRAKRIPPLRDDKILAAWNGLAISALAVAGRVLAEPRYVEAAVRAADFVLQKMRAPDGRILRSFTDGRAQAQGFLEDHAFMAAGLIDLYEAGFDPRFLTEAVAISESLEKHFADGERGGWFMSASDAEKLIAREKPSYDGAEPSGTSVAILNALRLGSFTSDDRFRQIAEKALSSLHDVLTLRGVAMTEALLALDFFTDAPREVAVVWPAGSSATDREPMLSVLRKTFVPNRVLAATADGAALTAAARIAGFLAGKVPQQGQVTAYVCERGLCELPATGQETFTSQLGRVKPYAH